MLLSQSTDQDNGVSEGAMNQELEDQLYAQVAREMATDIYDPASTARAAEKAAGDPGLARSLYIGLRVEQLARAAEQEARKRAAEEQRKARSASNKPRRQTPAKPESETEGSLGTMIAVLLWGIGALMIVGMVICLVVVLMAVLSGGY